MKPARRFRERERERPNRWNLNLNSSLLRTNLTQGYKKPWVFILKKEIGKMGGKNG